ncbi:2-octaprenyl-6-methoxyphenyl hydroxylase [Methylovorus sp. MM2]|uniref:FAD-dependent monooxygenase n=1 Tax=Methylovorus sp. MM2 TaxID=1848038 RepID=UPI0007E21DDD|nr:FAD-dependent monooxygenase [Methylovorus sp. MM2]OAM51413.1 2-octaprenyl-6-methoxyphenyl hydroxylase [Methylovorus sp. MM2]
MNLSDDIVIVGGGPVGATLALALQMQGIGVTMLEARTQGAAHDDQRALALSYGSRMILDRLGLWGELEAKATPINTIHISQRGSLGRTRLKAEEHGQPSLGYVLAYGDLSRALDMALANYPKANILYSAEALSIQPQTHHAAVIFNLDGTEQGINSRLAVLADGGKSLAEIPGLKRETKRYGHDALVSKVKCELPHQNIAYERFTPAGPVALLPNGPRDFSLVWTGKEEEIQPLLALGDSDFLSELHRHFGDRVGEFLSVGKRLTFPLKLSYLSPVTAPHLVVIGNAAQTMHPVAGQGFNVGLRDAWELAGQIASAKPSEIGGVAMMDKYQQGRVTDTKRGMFFTDFLVNTFSNEILGLNKARGIGIGLLDVLHPVKQHIVNKMSFGSRG